jgi:hypothetical protein
MALDTWDPRAAAAGFPIGYPAITTAYPQPPSPPNPAAYTDPVTRPAPTLTTVAPNTGVAATVVPLNVTLTGTLFTNASKVSFGGVLDSPRLLGVTFVSATTLVVSLNPVGLAAGAYQFAVQNKDGQNSGNSAYTLS